MHSQPVVIVTGASRGVGAHVARWLATRGAALTLAARSTEALKAVGVEAEQLGAPCLTLPGDISDPEACAGLVQETLARYGRLDAVINNAAVFPPIARVAEADPQSWHYNIEVNLLGPFYMCRAALPELRKQEGRLVNVSSAAAEITIIGGSAYCASKAALTHFTRVLAAEERGVTAVSVRPGLVDTDMQALIRSQEPGAMTEKQLAYFRGLKKDAKLESPQVPARAVAWLALGAPRDLSGQFLDYDDPRIAEPAIEFFGESLP